ncbi:GNAT family N-acetyltransferase [Clostridium bowmanii]|uniref:GNAT family N-acetyltransferase n=1 Tax=Clostridium bowmanii TaxID=132925 RepID=UPI001C0AD284|nr:GNAT family protein [Clostridium bowmanii]MBU3191845.1 GNAT family N-acetyltransferase [Clostridium bowmanii]MCA1076165.1 GNAT family N-acetyltransferase [Clostridium bowmanii]
MEIKSERLILKELKQKDLVFMYKMASEPLVYFYDEDEEPPSEEQIYEKYNKKISKMKENAGKHFIFLINLLPEEVPIGEVHIQLNWEEHREWEIGYVLHTNYWGNGYASEAVKLVLKHIFENLNAHRVVGFCNANNKKSSNLMERVGMNRDGLLREGILWHKEWCDEFVYSILEREFLSLSKFK